MLGRWLPGGALNPGGGVLLFEKKPGGGYIFLFFCLNFLYFLLFRNSIENYSYYSIIYQHKF
jgi:hypothetical protein